MEHTYQTEQWVPYPVEAVFGFFADPQNLPKLMPTWQNARIERAQIISPSPVGWASDKAAGVGSRITLSFLALRGLPLRVNWEAEISEFSWEGRFCDRQVKGPFALWRHCHEVRSVPSREVDITLITDRVDYELPFGFFGSLAHRLFVRRQIERTFAIRQARLMELLAATAGPLGTSTSS